MNSFLAFPESGIWVKFLPGVEAMEANDFWILEALEDFPAGVREKCAGVDNTRDVGWSP